MPLGHISFRCYIKPALGHIQSAASTVCTKVHRKVCWPVYMLNNKKKRKYYRALLFVTGYEPELNENCGEGSMQSTSIITCENPRREPNVLKIALSHFRNLIRVQTLLHPVPSTSIVRTFIDYISKLCAWLFAYSGIRTIVALVV